MTAVAISTRQLKHLRQRDERSIISPGGGGAGAHTETTFEKSIIVSLAVFPGASEIHLLFCEEVFNRLKVQSLICPAS